LQGAEASYHQLGKAMGSDVNSAEEVISYVAGLTQKFGLPTKLSEIGVKREDVSKLASLAAADFCLPCNHRSPSIGDLQAIYEKAL